MNRLASSFIIHTNRFENITLHTCQMWKSNKMFRVHARSFEISGCVEMFDLHIVCVHTKIYAISILTQALSKTDLCHMSPQITLCLFFSLNEPYKVPSILTWREREKKSKCNATFRSLRRINLLCDANTRRKWWDLPFNCSIKITANKSPNRAQSQKQYFSVLFWSFFFSLFFCFGWRFTCGFCSKVSIITNSLSVCGHHWRCVCVYAIISVYVLLVSSWAIYQSIQQ